MCLCSHPIDICCYSWCCCCEIKKTCSIFWSKKNHHQNISFCCAVRCWALLWWGTERSEEDSLFFVSFPFHLVSLFFTVLLSTFAMYRIYVHTLLSYQKERESISSATTVQSRPVHGQRKISNTDCYWRPRSRKLSEWMNEKWNTTNAAKKRNIRKKMFLIKKESIFWSILYRFLILMFLDIHKI